MLLGDDFLSATGAILDSSRRTLTIEECIVLLTDQNSFEQDHNCDELLRVIKRKVTKPFSMTMIAVSKR